MLFFLLFLLLDRLADQQIIRTDVCLPRLRGVPCQSPGWLAQVLVAKPSGSTNRSGSIQTHYPCSETGTVRNGQTDS
ncbi:hypothetical protein F5X68DRAFT_214179 [Plectosphaerella plurivora]|uniref:Secreted protein n=1 Tax=Plectosphaerella plurivora TaxID=936078 RepID=A0A9P8V4L2_9PEZI|nr:hypothetical protein F5X68DRAFT_214179 [Plectosphaerella plurivora]